MKKFVFIAIVLASLFSNLSAAGVVIPFGAGVQAVYSDLKDPELVRETTAKAQELAQACFESDKPCNITIRVERMQRGYLIFSASQATIDDQEMMDYKDFF